MPDWSFEPGAHPLQRDVPLRHVVELPVLGVRVRFECNAAHAAHLVEAAYGWWRPLLSAPDWISSAHVRIRVAVCAGAENVRPRPRLISRMPDNEHLLIHSAGSLALADTPRGEGVLYVTADLLDAGEPFLAGVLDAVTLMLVTRFDRVPVHAAMVVRGGSALLLASAGGVGKSTLAYAAHRAGYHVPADDTAYVQLDPQLRVWGAARALRVPHSGSRWFAELGGLEATIGADGDEKVTVPVREGPNAPSPEPVVERVGVCQLTRAGSRAALEPVEPGVLAGVLSAGLDAGFDRFRDQMPEVARRLCARGGWRLNLSSDPRDALPYIHEMLSELEHQP